MLNSTARAYVLLTTTAFCWGANSVLARLAVGEVSPMLIVSLRWLGVVMLFFFVRQAIYRDWDKLKSHLPLLFMMGALGFTAFNALFYLAAHTTTALNIGIIQGRNICQSGPCICFDSCGVDSGRAISGISRSRIDSGDWWNRAGRNQKAQSGRGLIGTGRYSL